MFENIVYFQRNVIFGRKSHGTSGRNRTGTLLPESDFESDASTNSATEALGMGLALLSWRILRAASIILDAAIKPRYLGPL